MRLITHRINYRINLPRILRGLAHFSYSVCLLVDSLREGYLTHTDQSGYYGSGQRRIFWRSFCCPNVKSIGNFFYVKVFYLGLQLLLCTFSLSMVEAER